MASTAELLNDIWYGKSPMRYALWPVSVVYRGLARLRRTAYRRGWRPTIEVPVPVIVVGNVSVGGTGKTPFVIWLADQLKQRGRKVGIVTRGYRGKGEQCPLVAPFKLRPCPIAARKPRPARHRPFGCSSLTPRRAIVVGAGRSCRGRPDTKRTSVPRFRPTVTGQR